VEQPLWIADITLSEITTLHDPGPISLDRPVREWLEAATAPRPVRRFGITRALAAQVASLPETCHREPADRIIVATARLESATLLTRDPRILSAEIIRTLS
jgi:PIN domain nuclease of toxin-antitoxin system